LLEVEAQFSLSVVRMRQVQDEQAALLQKRLRLRKEAGLLTQSEREMFAREIAAIDELDRLESEQEARELASVESSTPSEPAVRGAPDLVSYPAEFLDAGAVSEDWSFSQWLAQPDDTGLIVPGNP